MLKREGREACEISQDRELAADATRRAMAEGQEIIYQGSCGQKTEPNSNLRRWLGLRKVTWHPFRPSLSSVDFAQTEQVGRISVNNLPNGIAATINS